MLDIKVLRHIKNVSHTCVTHKMCRIHVLHTCVTHKMCCTHVSHTKCVAHKMRQTQNASHTKCVTHKICHTQMCHTQNDAHIKSVTAEQAVVTMYRGRSHRSKAEDGKDGVGETKVCELDENGPDQRSCKLSASRYNITFKYQLK